MAWDNYSHEQRLSVRVPNGLKDALTAAAREERRTMSQQVVMVLIDWLEGRSVPQPVRESVVMEQVFSDPRKELDVADITWTPVSGEGIVAYVPVDPPGRSTQVDLTPEDDSDLGATLNFQMMVAEGDDQSDLLHFVLESFECETCPECGHEDVSDSYGSRFFGIVNPDGRVRCGNCRQFFHPGVDFPEK